MKEQEALLGQPPGLGIGEIGDKNAFELIDGVRLDAAMNVRGARRAVCGGENPEEAAIVDGERGIIVRVVGALDTPVPYSPPLEAFFLPSEEEIERAARLLCKY